jgi:hypothetical protein
MHHFAQHLRFQNNKIKSCGLTDIDRFLHMGTQSRIIIPCSQAAHIGPG